MSHLAFGEKKTLDDVWPMRKKRFIVRTDFERIMEHGTTQPPSPLLQTITRIICAGGKVILALSFGDNKNPLPITASQSERAEAHAKFPEHLTAKPLVELLKQVTPVGVTSAFASDPLDAVEVVQAMADSSILVLENLRFYSNELSSDADERYEFASLLAQYGDIFVNDVFATSHLNSAGAVELPRVMRHGVCGVLMEEEMNHFSKMLVKPPRPVTVVLGGTWIEEKLKLLKTLIHKVDKILIGGAIALPFLMAKGIDVGRIPDQCIDPATSSFFWSDRSMSITQYVKMLEDLAQRCHVRIVLPIDFIAHTSTEATRFPTTTPGPSVPPELMPLDIGPRTCQLFTAEIRDSKTVYWTGEMGTLDMTSSLDDYNTGTNNMAHALGSSDCISVVGGRRTVASVKALGLEDRITHLTTGPNAALRVLEGSPLPGLEALSDAHPVLDESIELTIDRLFRRCKLFAECTPKQLKLLVQLAVPRRHSQGDIIMHEGDRFSSMFIVARGMLRAYERESQGKETAVRLIERQGSLGEWEFLTQKRSQEVVEATSDETVTYQLSLAALERAFEDYPSLAPQLLRNASEPLRQRMLTIRQEKIDDFTEIWRNVITLRKPVPRRPHAARERSLVENCLASIATTVSLHSLYQVYRPFKLEPGTCVLARHHDGLLLKCIHGIARECVFHQVDQHSGYHPAVTSLVANALTSPLASAAAGIPFHKMTAAAVVDGFLISGATSLLPAVAHGLFLKYKASLELREYDVDSFVPQWRLVAMAVLCRVLTCALGYPIIMRRPRAVAASLLGARSFIAYVLRQVLALLLEYAVHRVLGKKEKKGKC